MEFLDAVARRHGEASDYRLAQILGVSKQTISGYRQGKGFLGEEVALRVAQELSLNPGYVLACVAAERAKRTEVRRIWERLAKAAAGAAAVVLVAVFSWILAPDPGLASSGVAGLEFDQANHYAKWPPGGLGMAGSWALAALGCVLAAWARVYYPRNSA